MPSRSSRGTSTAEVPRICRITTADVPDALRSGWRDFLANPTQLIFLAILYPVIGLLAARAMAGGAVMPLVWPVASGFALVGPFAALGDPALSSRLTLPASCGTRGGRPTLGAAS